MIYITKVIYKIVSSLLLPHIDATLMIKSYKLTLLTMFTPRQLANRTSSKKIPIPPLQRLRQMHNAGYNMHRDSKDFSL